MKTWLAGIVMFAALSAAAQAEIVAGTVVDRATNKPVANAHVMILLKGAPSLQTKTDAAGRFTVETNATPDFMTVQSRRFEPYSMQLIAVAPSVMADLRIGLNTRLVQIEWYGPRTMCGAFQPHQLWDRYDVVPGGTCGAPGH